MVVPFCKRGSGGFWTLAFLTLGIVVAGVPLSRGGGEQNGDLDGGRESSGRGGADGGSVERSGPLRFRNPQNPMLNQENIMRHVEALGGGHLLRDIDTLGDERLQRPSRGFDSAVGSTFGGYKRLDPLIGTSFGGQKRSGGRLSNSITELLKRNFDEIDRSGFDSFVKRNNFDEIDRYGFDGFVRKRRSGGQMNADSSSDDEQRNEGMQSSQRGLDRN